MSQTAFTFDSAADTGRIDIFIDSFVSSFTYSVGAVTLSEITAPAPLTRAHIYFNVEKIEEWLALLKLNMPEHLQPQPAYSYEVEHDASGQLTFVFKHLGHLVLRLAYSVGTKSAIVQPRGAQTLTLRAFSRYVDALGLLVANIRLYKD